MANPSIQLGTNSNWAIKEDKLLAYKEYNDYFFNKEFDFSRGTSATYVAKDGLIKTAGIQPNIVTNGDFSELGSEVITNGDFSQSGTPSSSSYTLGWYSPDPGVSISNGELSLTKQSPLCRAYATDGISVIAFLTSGKTYKLVYTVTENNQGATLRYYNGTYININGSVGTHTLYYKAATQYFILLNASDNKTIKLDSVSVKQVDPNDYWTLGTGTTISENKVNFLNATGVSLYQDIGTQTGIVKVTFSVTDYTSGTLNVYSGGNQSISNVNVTANAVGSYFAFVDRSGGNVNIIFGSSDNFTGSIDNVTVQEIQTDTPRIDFTNDTKGHLLLEPSRTNLVTNSNDFSSYTFTNIDYNANNSISPDGSVNATKVTPNTSNAFHDLRTSANISLGSGNNTVSFFIKSNGYNFFELGVASNSGFSKYATAVINLNDGTNANTGVNQTWTITNVNISEFNSDWYRLELTFNVDTSTSTAMVFASSLPTSARGVAFQGDGTSGAYIYGLQLEEGDFSTSLINTTGAASTRNADVCNNSGSAQDFNSEEGVLYAEIAALLETAGATKQFTVTGSTTDNQIKFSFRNAANQLNFSLKSNGSTEVNFTRTISPATTNFFKIAFKYKVNDCALWVNGTEIATDTSAAMPLDLSSLQFDRGDGGNDFNGKVRNVQVFTEALTDAELQELTS